jgi:hypothetical protein
LCSPRIYSTFSPYLQIFNKSPVKNEVFSGPVPTYSPGNENNLVIAPQAQWGNNEQLEGHLIRTAIPGGR